MKIKEIADLTVAELGVKEREFREELFNLRMQARIGQIEKPSRIRDLRRAIARVQTVLSARPKVADAPKAPAKKA